MWRVPHGCRQLPDTNAVRNGGYFDIWYDLPDYHIILVWTELATGKCAADDSARRARRGEARKPHHLRHEYAGRQLCRVFQKQKMDLMLTSRSTSMPHPAYVAEKDWNALLTHCQLHSTNQGWWTMKWHTPVEPNPAVFFGGFFLIRIVTKHVSELLMSVKDVKRTKQKV